MKKEIVKELGAGRVAFLARKEAIKTEIETGRTVKSVYREHQAQLGIGYVQFLKYVNQFIKGKNENSKQKSVHATDEARERPSAEHKPIRTRAPGEPAFVSSVTPRDDLIHPKPKE